MEASSGLLMEKHKRYIKELDAQKSSFEYWVTEQLRMNGVYWGLAAMDVMQSLHEMDRDAVVRFVKDCFDARTGGFGGNVGHDPHILYTLSAIQVLCMFDALDAVDCDAVARFMAALQQPDGSFAGDEWGEIDTRFSYCAICGLALLRRLHLINLDKAVEFIARQAASVLVFTPPY